MKGLAAPEIIPPGWELKGRSYWIDCPRCSASSSFRPSVAMLSGSNTGLFACPGCRESLFVQIDAENKGGIATRISEL